MAGQERQTRAERRRQTEGRILAAARDQFAERGYDRTTIRAVAAAAGVDPALVMQYFGSKDGLFRQAVHVPDEDALPDEPAEFTELLLAILGVKLGKLPETSLPLLRSAFTHPEAAQRLRAALLQQVGQASAGIRAEDAELRAALVVAVLLGVSIGRHLLELDQLRDASVDDINRILRPSLAALVQSGSQDA